MRLLLRGSALRARLLAFGLIAVTAAVVVAGSQATYSGTNGRITFARYVPAPNSIEIFSASSTGGSVQQLTTSGQNHNSEFSSWSPNGNTIAFDSDRPGDGTGDVQIWTMNWDGTGQTQLTTGPGFHGDPAWTPDGSKLAVEADWGDYPALEGIWLIPSSGSVTMAQATRVTAEPTCANAAAQSSCGGQFDEEPRVSPDGNWITFTRYLNCRDRSHGHLLYLPNGCTSAIFRVRVDGTGLQRLTPWGLNADESDYSPSGDRIAFDSCDSGRSGCSGSIYVMNADGSGLTEVVGSPPVLNAGHDSANSRFDYRGNPVWSPDGTKLLYTHWHDGITELVTANPDGSGETTLVAADPFQNWADWGTHP
jgi:Tol biopolymer transport system component